MKEMLKIAYIGHGGRGKYHIMNFVNMPDCEVVAVCDKLSERADAMEALIKEKTGKTPVEYLNGYRIEKASQLLLNSDQSVTEIAFSCGFNDLSYFIKTFKSQKGISPAKFRKTEH